jgi:hypothetical protein
MDKVSIFYVNSIGIMSQWKGTILSKDDKSITIRFSKNKALKFNLLDLDIDFCLVTNKPMKDIGVCVSKTKETVSFDENLKDKILLLTKNNVKHLWQNRRWEV